MPGWWNRWITGGEGARRRSADGSPGRAPEGGEAGRTCSDRSVGMRSPREHRACADGRDALPRATSVPESGEDRSDHAACRRVSGAWNGPRGCVAGRESRPSSGPWRVSARRRATRALSGPWRGEDPAANLADRLAVFQHAPPWRTTTSHPWNAPVARTGEVLAVRGWEAVRHPEIRPCPVVPTGPVANVVSSPSAPIGWTAVATGRHGAAGGGPAPPVNCTP